MLLIVVSSAVVLAVLLALGLAIGQLKRQVHELSAQLAELSSRAHMDGDASAADAPLPAARGVPREDAAAPEPVPVITEIPGGRADDVDLTRTRVASVTLARPLIKVAALSHGVRRALGGEQRMRVRYTMRQELRRQRKMRRRRRASQAPSPGWRP